MGAVTASKILLGGFSVNLITHWIVYLGKYHLHINVGIMETWSSLLTHIWCYKGDENQLVYLPISPIIIKQIFVISSIFTNLGYICCNTEVFELTYTFHGCIQVLRESPYVCTLEVKVLILR